MCAEKDPDSESQGPGEKKECTDQCDCRKERRQKQLYVGKEGIQKALSDGE